MTSQSQGVQQLLAAEKKASEKVNEARKRSFDFRSFPNLGCVPFREAFPRSPEMCAGCLSWNAGKAKRLKQAKDEAQVEIDKFKADKERQFKEYEAKHMGSKEDIASKIEAETRQKMAEMNQQVAQHKKAVIEKLISLVYEIDPKVHRNFRP
ncbi:hypothetical protein HPB48_000524 [Haemaphysalis longicornis]|uniref:V-type proton ATPase subunit G n=1 Tax=Haemaphysalis longicornis TaxID=44386 RepID=A0A9J6GQP6_HAELO|nr:hypothetical protein HPB48_000524 [Haemaphysalis longicornis]